MYEPWQELKQDIKIEHVEEKKLSFNAKKFAGLVCLIIIGCAMLGLGIGVGYAGFGNRGIAGGDIADIQQQTTFRTVSLQPLSEPFDAGDISFVDAISAARDAVVSISSTTITGGMFSREATGAGSGFIFGFDEEFVYIATNKHVVSNARTITVSLDDEKHVAARIVGYDRDMDTAVLAVSRAALLEADMSFSVLPIGNSSEMRLGDPVVAMGNSMGHGQSVTQGIISVTNLQITVTEPSTGQRIRLDVLQTDAAVNPGNSGGPLINERGEVIAIVTAKYRDFGVQGMGYAIPIDDIKHLLMEFMAQGIVRRPWIGIGHNIISEALSVNLNLPSAGSLVTSVVPNSPACEAGIEEWDLIVRIGEHEIEDLDSFVVAINSFRPGDEAIFGIYRRNEFIELLLIFGASY